MDLTEVHFSSELENLEIFVMFFKTFFESFYGPLRELELSHTLWVGFLRDCSLKTRMESGMSRLRQVTGRDDIIDLKKYSRPPS
ncbi:hypothetical protein Baya_14786 [Bagarius yarrelli]|uniref:Uncharacterized protein n=1 Tax=Bagarius yarrelli TaxID=175774 RepID=A0A556VA33_BAGYA|nr:hypothetical protein Baya_14786 [Bagarius yarrelli]